VVFASVLASNPELRKTVQVRRGTSTESVIGMGGATWTEISHPPAAASGVEHRCRRYTSARIVSPLSPHRLMLAILFNIGPDNPAVQHSRSRGWRDSGNIRQ
jgi:hypothetical protein